MTLTGTGGGPTEAGVITALNGANAPGLSVRIGKAAGSMDEQTVPNPSEPATPEVVSRRCPNLSSKTSILP